MIDVDFKIINLQNEATIYSGDFKKCNLTVRFIAGTVTNEVKGINSFIIEHYDLNYDDVLDIMKALKKTSKKGSLLFELYSKEDRDLDFTIVARIAVKCDYSSIRIIEDSTKSVNNFSLSLTLEESRLKID